MIPGIGCGRRRDRKRAWEDRIDDPMPSRVAVGKLISDGCKPAWIEIADTTYALLNSSVQQNKRLAARRQISGWRLRRIAAAYRTIHCKSGQRGATPEVAGVGIIFHGLDKQASSQLRFDPCLFENGVRSMA